MRRIQITTFIFLILISIQGKSQFFEYDNHLSSSKIALQDSSSRGIIGIDMTTNSKYFVDKSFECGALYKVYEDNKENNSITISSNLRNYFNKSSYFDNSSFQTETDLAVDGYYISVGLIYQLSRTNLKFSYGIAPTYSHYYQDRNPLIGFNSTLLFEFKRIMLISNLVANQFNENVYESRDYYNSINYGPYSRVSETSYITSSIYFKLNKNSDERIYLKYFIVEEKKMAIGFSIPIINRVIINPEIQYRLSSSYFDNSSEDRYSFGLFGKVRFNKFFIKSFATYHKDFFGEDLYINLGFEYLI